jgi:hypothetical protein
MKKKQKEKGKRRKQTTTTDHTITSLSDLQHDELSGGSDETSLDKSSSDEDENEGLGDGNMGRSRDDLFSK